MLILNPNDNITYNKTNIKLKKKRKKMLNNKSIQQWLVYTTCFNHKHLIIRLNSVITEIMKLILT